MKLSFDALKKFEINTVDKKGAAKVENLIFSSDDFRLRYIVARCGSWLFGDKVLVNPATLRSIDFDLKEIFLNIGSEKLESCPSRNNVETLSEELFAKVYEHYPSMDPHTGFAGWGYVGGPVYAESQIPPAKVVQSRTFPGEGNEPPNRLHSLLEMKGYSVKSPGEGEIGQIREAILDLKEGTVRYFVVDTGSWLKSKKFLVGTDWVNYFDPLLRNMECDLSKKQIEQCPEYDSSVPINRSFEERLYDFHGRPYYWHTTTRHKIPLAQGAETNSTTLPEVEKQQDSEMVADRPIYGEKSERLRDSSTERARN